MLSDETKKKLDMIHSKWDTLSDDSKTEMKLLGLAPKNENDRKETEISE